MAADTKAETGAAREGAAHEGFDEVRTVGHAHIRKGPGLLGRHVCERHFHLHLFVLPRHNCEVRAAGTYQSHRGIERRPRHRQRIDDERRGKRRCGHFGTDLGPAHRVLEPSDTCTVHVAHGLDRVMYPHGVPLWDVQTQGHQQGTIQLLRRLEQHPQRIALESRRRELGHGRIVEWRLSHFRRDVLRPIGEVPVHRPPQQDSVDRPAEEQDRSLATHCRLISKSCITSNLSETSRY